MNYQVLELPYKGDEFSLIMILPAEEIYIEEMEKLITAHQIFKWFSEMQEEEVEISLPRLVMSLYCSSAFVFTYGENFNHHSKDNKCLNILLTKMKRKMHLEALLYILDTKTGLNTSALLWHED